MNNEQRATIGRQLLELYNSLCRESCVDEDTVRDAIADILHAAVADNHIAVNQLENTCRICINNVRDELDEEREASA